MAIMLPARLPEREETTQKITQSERIFFDCLRDKLPDDFYIYHSMGYLEPSGARQGEVDFLVLHPKLGMLVIECKGYGVIRDHQGQWWRTSTRGKDCKIKPPNEQARQQVGELLKTFASGVGRFLRDNRNEFPLCFGWALAFPLSSWDAINPPPELDPAVVFDMHALENLHERVVAAMKFHARHFGTNGPPTLDMQSFHRLRHDVISPELDLAPRLGGQINLERIEMVRLTKSQIRIVERLRENHRLRVPGGAGTGKTILALHAARMHASRKKDVLLVCFNSNLGDHLRDTAASFQELPGSIEAANFHRLCSRASHLLYNRGLDVPQEPEAQKEFWLEVAPLILLEAIVQQKIGPWDAIIVDEGQDFAPVWWEVLEEGLRDKKRSKIAVFYDDAQRIFDHGSPVPDYPASYTLNENFRNTKAIANVVRTLGEVEMNSHPDCAEGADPIVYQHTSPSKSRKQLTSLLDELIVREKLRCDQIAILSPRSAKNSFTEGATELGDHTIVHRPADWSKGVLHTTISGFKGLEADVVIMINIDPDDERCNRNARYVAASRACHRLYVFARGNWLDAGAPADASTNKQAQPIPVSEG